MCYIFSRVGHRNLAGPKEWKRRPRRLVHRPELVACLEAHWHQPIVMDPSKWCPLPTESWVATIQPVVIRILPSLHSPKSRSSKKQSMFIWLRFRFLFWLSHYIIWSWFQLVSEWCVHASTPKIVNILFEIWNWMLRSLKKKRFELVLMLNWIWDALILK